MILTGKIDVKITPYLDGTPLCDVIYIVPKINIEKTYEDLCDQNGEVIIKRVKTITLTLYCTEDEDENRE